MRSGANVAMTLREPAIPVPVSDATSESGVSERMLLLAIAIGTTLAPLNSTMIAVALPDIQRAFDVSVTATASLVTIYLVAMAVGQPIGGRLGAPSPPVCPG
jgi:predicted MFS family arabinose efflux permease